MTSWEALKKVVKPKNIIVLIVLIVSNSFAWFIYATQIDNQMNAHVSAWDILFEAGDSPIVDYLPVNIDKMFPGMDPFLYSVNAHNRSEVAALLNYELLEVRILDDTYISQEGKRDKGLVPLIDDPTSAELIEKIETEYPFKIKIEVTTLELDASIGMATYSIEVTWPFDSGDDEADTFWGEGAATYKKNNPTLPSIALKLKISITQIEE